MIKKQYGPVTELLMRGKARFTSKDVLVKNWENIFETKTGKSTYNSNKACRFCIVGGIFIEHAGHDNLEMINETERQAEWFLARARDNVCKNEYKTFNEPFTLTEVRKIYTEAIKLAKEERL